MILFLILILILLLALPGISHAYQVDAVGPKSDELLALEKQMYGLANMSIAPYTMPLGSQNDKIVSAGKGGATGASGTGAAASAGAGNNDAFQQAAMYGTKVGGRVTQNKDGTYTVTYEGGEGQNGGPRSVTRTFGTPSATATAAAPQAAQAAGGNVPSLSLNGLSIPQPYDANTLMGQLFNDATKKTYVANDRYDSLMSQAPQLSGQISSLLGQGVDAVNQSKTAGDKYFAQADDMFSDSARYLKEGEGYLSRAGSEGDWWYDKAKGAYAQAEGFIPQIQDQFSYTNEANKWYDDYTRGMLGGAKNMLDTGSIPEPLMNAMIAAMRSGVDQTVGTNINDLASRGVLNSSVTNRALAGVENEVANAMNSNYLNAFDSILGGYNSSAQTGANAGKAFADTNLNIISGMNDTLGNMIGLGDSYGKTGSMRVNDLLGVAQGYGDYSGIANQNAGTLMDAGSQRIADWLDISKGYNDSATGYGDLLDLNLKEREGIQSDLSKYYANAAAPMIPAYDVLKTMQQDHWNSNKKDTVVSQGGGLST